MNATTTKPPRSAHIMTFRELLTERHESSGNCRFCKEWGRRGRYYGVRHFVCNECCEKRVDEKLPSVLRAEKKAAAYVKRLRKEGRTTPASFVSTLSGVYTEFAKWLMEQRP